MKVEIDLPEIEGFEYTGEYREPQVDEWYYSGWRPVQAECAVGLYFPILTPTEKWIVPTLEYLQEHYKWGDKVEARFRSNESFGWVQGKLTDIVDEQYHYQIDNKDYYKYCEIKEVRG